MSGRLSLASGAGPARAKARGLRGEGLHVCGESDDRGAALLPGTRLYLPAALTRQREGGVVISPSDSFSRSGTGAAPQRWPAGIGGLARAAPAALEKNYQGQRRSHAADPGKATSRYSAVVSGVGIGS